jgi:Ribbon-helix-helix domain
MKSSVVKRSIVLAGHKTSVSLEDAFWRALKEIAGGRQITLSNLISEIDSERQQAIYRRPYNSSCSTSTADLLTVKDDAERIAYSWWRCLHEYRCVGTDSASAVWGRFRFEPVGGGTKIKAVRLICPCNARAELGLRRRPLRRQTPHRKENVGDHHGCPGSRGRHSEEDLMRV